MKILLIEDETKIARYIKKGFEEHGFTIEVATNGEDGLFIATTEQYDLLIVDIMLPKLSGWDLVKELRSQSSHLPILILTARDEIQDKVKGFELGADDYLVKPFSFYELLARVRSLLRRRQIPQQVETLTAGDLTINLLKCTAHRNKKLINLTAQEFKLLAFLMQHQSEVTSRTVLAEQIWGMHFNSDTNVVDVAIKRLRQKIEDGTGNVKFIHTIRGMGYFFEERITHE